ncbi:ABC transporter ATP-binding protein [Rhodovibrionaceae bacterium A322]
MSDALLSITGLTAGYSEGVVLEALDLSLPKGEVLGLLGHNGAGKSTLMKTLMGLLPAQAGDIAFAGQSLSGLPSFEIARRGLAYVPQGREIFGNFSVEENLILGNLTRRDFQEIYDLFPVLQEMRRRPAGNLSGGQQQQLAVARALVSDPKLLLLDEPSEGVQPNIVAEIARIVKEVAAQRDMTVILVEQNVDMILAMCSRLAFMQQGHIVAETPVTDPASAAETIRQYMSL